MEITLEIRIGVSKVIFVCVNSDLPMYIFLMNSDMGVPFQARSRYFSRLAVLKLS